MSWDDSLASRAAADNLFMDHAADTYQAEFADLARRHGACRPDGDIVAENALRGEWRLRRERGSLTADSTLAPTAPPRVQHLSVRSIMPLDPRMAVAEIPPLRLRSRLRYDAGRYFAEAEGVFLAAQEFLNTDLLETRTPGYGTANLLVGANLGAVTVQVIASNIFDVLYYENLSYQRDPFRSGVRVYEPGANLFINFTYRFGQK